LLIKKKVKREKLIKFSETNSKKDEQLEFMPKLLFLKISRIVSPAL